MEIHDITKLSFNLRQPENQAKNSTIFQIKEVNDEEDEYYEFEFNKILKEKLSIWCKKCGCHLHLPNNGIQIEERITGKKITFVISAQTSEVDFLDKNNYEEPFYEHKKRCPTKCTALQHQDCGVHKYRNVQRRFRTATVRNAL